MEGEREREGEGKGEEEGEEEGEGEGEEEHPDIESVMDYMDVMVEVVNRQGEEVGKNQIGEAVRSQGERLLGLQIVMSMMQKP